MKFTIGWKIPVFLYLYMKEKVACLIFHIYKEVFRPAQQIVYAGAKCELLNIKNHPYIEKVVAYTLRLGQKETFTQSLNISNY